jgi:hypothetical protein
MRQDIYDNSKRTERILKGHEKYELTLMETKGLTYKQAHRKAELHEKFYLFEKDLENLEKNLKIPHHEPVRIIEPKREPDSK